MTSTPLILSPLETPDEREKRLIRKIEIICWAITRGKKSKSSPWVVFYRWNVVLNSLLSVLGGAGLLQLFPNAGIFTGSTTLMISGIVALVVAVGIEVFKQFEIEKIAVSAIAANEAFELLELTLIEAVGQDGDPTDQINVVLKEAYTLLRHFIIALPKDDECISRDAKSLREYILKNKGLWQLK